MGMGIKEKIAKVTIQTRKIKKFGIIESHTKIIDSSKYYEKNNKNYNTFCVLKSIDDIFYLVYIKDNTRIVFYNLIDERKVIDIYTDSNSYSDNALIAIKYLFDQNNKRDLLLSLSKNFILKLWNINNFECLFEIKIDFPEFINECNYLGILKLNDTSYNILVSDWRRSIKIFDLNGNKLKDNYRNNLKSNNKIQDFNYLEFIDTYYDKKLCKTFIFMFNDISIELKYNKLYSLDFQKGEFYQEYDGIYNYNGQIIINDDDENLIKVIYLINYDSIGIFNFHTGKLIYKINLTVIPFQNSKFVDEYHYDIIYSLNFWNNNYISLSYGTVFEAGGSYGDYGAIFEYDKKYHSIEIINLKEEKMKQVFKLEKVDTFIFVKKIFHPNYGDCLLTQDDCGEINLIKIKLI